MISILMESRRIKRLSRNKLNIRRPRLRKSRLRQAVGRYTGTTPIADPGAQGRSNPNPTRRSLGLVGQQSRSMITSFHSSNDLPSRLIQFINTKVFPKYYKKQGTIGSIDKMRIQAEYMISSNDIIVIKKYELLCFLYLKDMSYWYSFKNKKIYVYDHNNSSFNNNPIHYTQWLYLNEVMK